MRYLLMFLMVGCTTVAPPVPVVQQSNKDKDKYVDRLEHEASESAAAIIVAKKNVTGKGKPLLDLTETRLSGIKKPTAEQVDKFDKTLADTKALETEQTKAKAVDAETTKLYERVAKTDKENEDLRTSIAAMNKEKSWDKLSGRFFWMATIFGLGGGALLVVSTFVGGQGRLASLCMIVLSVFFGGAPFVIRDTIESPWFMPVSLSVAGLAAIWGTWAYLHSHRQIKSRLTPKQDA